MSIPLDRLYHYIERISQDIVSEDNILIYRFYPDGAKNLDNLIPLRPLCSTFQLYQRMYCHDQEPLTYAFYEKKCQSIDPDSINSLFVKYNLQRYIYKNIDVGHNIYDQPLLVHSEKRSKNLICYQQANFITIYYWCHAIIALDWFRFAQKETQQKNIKNIFLIYNRAWSGTREYRLKFIDLLIEHNLVDSCHVYLNAVEPELGSHYGHHQFANDVWKPINHLEHYVKNKSTAGSHYSADYDIGDYNATEIEIVLETLFDDDRLMLTEKTLRPIALGQPFILASTHGSLGYLHSYGFKTYSDVFDETYDTIEDPYLRLQAVVNLMNSIANWSDQERKEKMLLANQIAEYNRNYFFSDDFFKQVDDELRLNLHTGLTLAENTNTSKVFFDRRKVLYNITELKNILLTPDTRDLMKRVVLKARQYYMRSTKNL